MNMLQIGAPKSGNFWLYKILKNIILLNGEPHVSYIEKQPIYQLAKHWKLNYPEQAQIDMIDITDLQTSYRISSIYRMPIENMSEYVSKTPHVWTHSSFCNASTDVFSHFDKKIYIIRDPRDMAISASIYFCSDYMLKYYPQPERDPKNYLDMHFDRMLHDWVWHVFDHLKFSSVFNIQIVFYEAFVSDFQLELEQLLNYLNITLPLEERAALEKQMSFSSLKKSNPEHLKKGTFGYWREQLSYEQKEKAQLIAGPLLDVLGYNLLQKDGDFKRPNISIDFHQLKSDLLSSQQLLYKSPNS